MATTHLRPFSSSRFRRSRIKLSVDTLQDRIALLVAQRQELRFCGATEATLERNRLQIARSQWELAHALIDRYLPAPAERSAA
jgi:hypothetical protein